MRYFLIISFIFLPSILFPGDQADIDSLEHVIKNSFGKQKLQLLIELSDSYTVVDPQKAISYGEEAFDLAQTLKDKTSQAMTLNNIGFGYFYSYDFKKATQYLLESLDLYKNIGDKQKIPKTNQNIGLSYLQANDYEKADKYLSDALDGFIRLDDQKELASCYTNLGLVSFMKSEYSIALDYYNQASEIYEIIDDSIMYAALLNRIGMTYWSLGINDKALSFLLRSMKLKEKVNNPKRMAIGYNNIGAIYKDLDEKEKALEYYQKALSAYREAGDSLDMPSTLTNIGSIFSNRGDNDEALSYYNEALAISIAVGDDFQAAKTQHNMGAIFLKTGQYDTAEQCFQNYLEFCKRIGNKEGIARAFLSLGDVSFETGEYNKSLFLLNECVSLANDIQSLQILKSAYSLLSKLYQATGNEKTAFDYYKLYTNVKDSIYNSEKAKAITEMQTKYETEKKEKENLTLKKDNEIQSLMLSRKNILVNSMAIGIILSLLLLVIIFYQYRKRTIAYKFLVKKNMELARSDKEIFEKGDFSSEDIPGWKQEYLDNTDNRDKNIELIRKFNKYFTEEKPYLYSDLNIEDICAKLGTNRTYLSKAINLVINKSFNSIINEFRVRAARQLLIDPRYSHISITGIGEMVGYNTKAAFHKNFKKITGLTPSYFKASIAVG